MILRLTLTVCFVLALCTRVALGQNMIQQDSKIVFLGDSITQAGVGPDGYVTIIRREIEKSNPDKNVEIIGAGISGNRVPDLQARLDRDVLSKKPTLVFIYIGINDVWHTQSGRGTSPADFESGLLDIIKRINDAGAKVILCTPTTIGEMNDGSNELDTMLEEFSTISRNVAKKTNTQLLDLRTQFIEHLKSHNPRNVKKNILTRDGVHLNPAGNDFLAAQMLSTLGVKYESQISESVMRHIVMLQFKDTTTDTQKDEIITAFADLANKIDLIIDYDAGLNVSPEGLADGFTHACVVTFRDAAARDAYLVAPAHKEFVKMLDGKLEKVLVFDFKTGG